MPTAILRPDSTVANTGSWVITGAATAHAAVSEVVTQPTAGSSAERVSIATANRVLDLGLSDSPSDVGEVTCGIL